VCRVPLEEARSICSWCARPIPDNAPVFGLGGKARPGVDLSEYQGGAIRITLVSRNRNIISVVPGADSEARRKGHDFMFMVCSKTCGHEMKAALKGEIALGDALFGGIERMENN